ncbi:MAG: hypothetical protein AAF431_11780 [Pseudomonadota bacterium]
MDWLLALYAEQTSADEIVIFLLLGTFTTLVFAFVIYAIVLLLLSRLRMDKSYTIGQLLFPSASRIRRNLGEYCLSIITAVLLALTVSVRHQQVELVLEQDIALAGQDLVKNVLAPGTNGDLQLDLVGSNAAEKNLLEWISEESTRNTGIHAETLIRPLLDQGMNRQANLIVQAIVDKLSTSSKMVDFAPLLEKALIIAAIVLLLAYAIWFSWQRSLSLQKNGVSDPDYSGVVKKLALPAVCIPLLLLSAVALSDSTRIAKSAIAKAQVMEQLAFAQPISQPSISTVVHNLRVISLNQDDELQNELLQHIAQLERELSELQNQVSDTPGKLNALGERINNSETSIQTLGRSDEQLSAEQTRLANTLQQHINEFTGLQTSLREITGNIDETNRNLRIVQAELERTGRELDSLETAQQAHLENFERFQASTRRQLAAIDRIQRDAQNALTTARDMQQNYQSLLTRHRRDLQAAERRLVALERDKHNHKQTQYQIE